MNLFRLCDVYFNSYTSTFQSIDRGDLNKSESESEPMESAEATERSKRLELVMKEHVNFVASD